MQRIEPVLNADGQPVEINPPAGGSWVREADGGLRPADAATAAGAGLEWPQAAATASTTDDTAEIVPDPVATMRSSATKE